MLGTHAILCLLTFQFPSAVEQGIKNLWALPPEDVARLATGRSTRLFAPGQGLYTLPGRGQGEAQGVVQSASSGGPELRVHL